jgi:hypothetical protein
MIPMLMLMMKCMRDLRVKIGVLQLSLFKDILTEEVKVKIFGSTQ